MPKRFWLLILLVCCLQIASVPAQVSANRYSDQDLEKLVGPVALYPDTLLTHVLAASTEPNQVAQAYKLTQSGAKTQSAPKDMPPSVAALMDFPQVLGAMASNTDWTSALGYAMNTQSSDVMRAVQQCRAKAYAAGTLKSTEQLVVEKKQDIIFITSPTPQVVYVPQYTSTSMYTPGAAALTFGAGMAVGAMYTSAACNWAHHAVYYGPPGCYAAYRPGYGVPPAGGVAWAAHPTPYSGVPGYRPPVNNINYANVNVNANRSVNVNNVNVNNNVNRVNNATWKAPGTPGAPGVGTPGARPGMPAAGATSARPPMGASTLQMENGVEARQASARGRQTLSQPTPAARSEAEERAGSRGGGRGGRRR